MNRKNICHAERSEASRMRLRGCLRDPSLALRMTIALGLLCVLCGECYNY